MRWFRLYRDINSNPKIVRLSDSLVGQWVRILAATEPSGFLPPIIDLSVIIRKSQTVTSKILAELKVAGLIDEVESRLIPHNWVNRQFKSDASKDRMQRHRKRIRDVTVTPPDTDKKNYPSKEGSSSSSTGFAFVATPVSLTEQQTYAWQEEFPDLDLKRELEQATAPSALPLTAGGWHYQLRQHLRRRQKTVEAAKRTVRQLQKPPKPPPEPPKPTKPKTTYFSV